MVVHHTSISPKVMGNQMLLAMCFLVTQQGMTAKQAYHRFKAASLRDLMPFTDSGNRFCSFTISHFDVLQGLEKAKSLGWYSPKSFNPSDYFRLN